MSYTNPPEGVFVPFSGGWRGCQLTDGVSQTRKSRRLEKFKTRVSVRTNHRCFYCGYTGDDWTMEHLIPRSLGGLRSVANIVRACYRCNQRRGDSPKIRQFMRDFTFVDIAIEAEVAIETILLEKDFLKKIVTTSTFP